MNTISGGRLRQTMWKKAGHMPSSRSTGALCETRIGAETELKEGLFRTDFSPGIVSHGLGGRTRCGGIVLRDSERRPEQSRTSSIAAIGGASYRLLRTMEAR